MARVKELAPTVEIAAACEALGVPRSSFYRAQHPPRSKPTTVPVHPTPPRALSAFEKEQVRAVLTQRHDVPQAAYAAHPERFVKGAPVAGSLPTAEWINRPQPVFQLQPRMAY